MFESLRDLLCDHAERAVADFGLEVWICWSLLKFQSWMSRRLRVTLVRACLFFRYAPIAAASP